ncbi:polysaccharide biosynthesis tyrosine autokinase [Mumia zhuanghuii]|uniref:non-specific protein-tyrosine kinase n=2 Tax=Mumia TaxID=1546255 RepID=A0ABW1QGH9_9ACTN|nr:MULTISPECIES: polysaccharide biosynthesis tyrosine autokinase [Mumia]KAA1422784.1 polysaccharide biosynthesis tyrosine autokinase [Mumia zhuanghuii]
MTFSEYAAILQRRWRVWVSFLVVGILAAVAYNATATVRYTSTATAFVNVSDGSSGQQAQNFQNSQFAVQRVKSYTSLVDSPRVLEPVIIDLRLDLTVRELARKTSMTSPPDTVVMEVSVVDEDPDQAALIANAVTESLGAVIEDIESNGTVSRTGEPESNVRVSITAPATPPISPSSPRTLINLVLGALLGLSAGMVAAVVRNHYDRRIKSADDVREVTGISPLGTTSHQAASQRMPLVALDWRSEAAERFRTIRTALRFASIDREVRHFVVTSPLSGEGKSTAACNLAISLAQGGASVCLVEADLRRPRAAGYLGVDGNLGLSDVLVGAATLDDVLVSWNHALLQILPAGSLPPDPVALLESTAMGNLVEALSERFDVVVYDAPPMLPVTDATVLGEKVDGLLLVVRSGKSLKEDLTRSLDKADAARVKVLGTVVVGVRREGRSGEHAYAADVTSQRTELSPTTNEPPARGEGITHADVEDDDHHQPPAVTTAIMPAVTDALARGYHFEHDEHDEVDGDDADDASADAVSGRVQPST